MSNTQAKKQKRKRRLEHKAVKAQRPSYTYDGAKFRTPRLTPLMFELEQWLCKVDALLDERDLQGLTDEAIERVYRHLIDKLHAGAIALAHGGGSTTTSLEIGCDPSDPKKLETSLERTMEQLIVDFSKDRLISTGDVIGVLRSLNGSLATWTEEDLGGRGYIDFIQEHIGTLPNFTSEYVVQETNPS